ncbi:geranylgeranyl pyrophosphate synthase [Superficieibacter electus]|uniref:Geranylgeranyl pyrophosphate synthase n=1 Tax=Superficieibacter electus TaxID=2022662 RepID=A0A2P5GS93_9ENTR|nr:polyprenyl synthetase family protein [Superficieibacter electus]POP46671.1 geranylgeranyl pyrophosphate synthase [Superficieibacter electus]POP49409.1 geranylgeranyl pyrophosphate synthase [Superficieibacter electus]
MNVDYEQEMQALRVALQQRLEQLLPVGNQQDRVGEAMREGTLAAGKRIRPLLLLLTAKDLGCDPDKPGLLDLACAVEMIHAASLMLDDIPCMDNAMQRRGMPTIHRQYGESVAILAAIGLLSRAFGVVAEAQSLPHAFKTQVVTELSTAVGMQGLVQGQYRDLVEGRQARSAEAILLTNDLKTSRLFDATLQMAAIVADASVHARQRLRCFAQDLGLVFQLMDDLSDGVSGTGKDINQDSGKSTLVEMLGVDAVHQRLCEHLRSADEHLAIACNQGQSTRRFMRVWFDKQKTMFGLDWSLPEC